MADQPEPLYRILSIDGGGIRGLMPAIWLTELERRLGGPVADHFDLIAGTSTGAILACGLAKRIPAKKLARLYGERGRDIFPGRGGRLWSRATRLFSDGVSAPKYESDGLEEVLKDQLGDTRLGDLPEIPDGPGLLVPTYDTVRRKPRFFKSWYDEHSHVPLWEVAKSSSSAPTYFPAHVSKAFGAKTALVDGGVAANNPVASAIAELIRLNRDPKRASLTDPSRFVVASLGTGISTRPISIEQAREWGAAEWAIPVISVLMDGCADSATYVAQQIVGEEGFFRFDTRLDRAFDDLDDASATNLQGLRLTAEEFLDQPGADDLFDRLVGAL